MNPEPREFQRGKWVWNHLGRWFRTHSIRPHQMPIQRLKSLHLKARRNTIVVRSKRQRIWTD